MNQADTNSSAIKCSAVRVQAALLAASCQNDHVKEKYAAQELERLAALNFSAMSAGRDVVYNLIEEGSQTLVNTYLRELPIDMLGLTSGHASDAAFKALSSKWVPILDEEMGDYLPKAEAESLCRDLWVASKEYIAQTIIQSKARKRKRAVLIKRVLPETLTVGLNSWILEVKARWRFIK